MIALMVIGWTTSIAVLASLVLMVMLCVCKKNKDKDSFSLTERALPDIPVQPTNLDQVVTEVSETGAVNVRKSRPKSYNPKKSPAPLPPIRNSLPPLSICPPPSSSPVLGGDPRHEPGPSGTHQLGNSDDPVEVVAREAVAGNVLSAEIPYMTPPLVVSPEPLESPNQEAPYTTISVREPLAKVRQQTLQMRKSYVEKNHYSVVTEGEEQMYAEINSDQTTRVLQPPSPPTVESLKTVAQAHSRQASITSNCSAGSMSTPGPSQQHTMDGLYSIIDKSNKQRKTIHIAEGVGLLAAGSSGSLKLEEMYAKVNKKKSLDDLSLTETSVSDGANGPDAGAHRRSPFKKLPPEPYNDNYSDPGYECVQHQGSTDSEYDKTLTLDSDDPGYERIRKDGFHDPPYERIRDLKKKKGVEPTGRSFDGDSSDPDYESVRNATKTSLNSIDDEEPNYESISNKAEADDTTDPCYETVNLRDKEEEEEEDPCYECVQPRKTYDTEELGYDTIKRLEDEEEEKQVYQAPSDCSDPGYERIRHLSEETPGYERVSPPTSLSFSSKSPVKPTDLNGCLPQCDANSPNATTTVCL